MSCVASYDMEPFTGQSMAELTAYVNRMNELLRYVLHNLDEENMTDEMRIQNSEIRIQN